MTNSANRKTSRYHEDEQPCARDQQKFYFKHTVLYILYTKWWLVVRGHLAPFCMVFVTSKTHFMYFKQHSEISIGIFVRAFATYALDDMKWKKTSKKITSSPLDSILKWLFTCMTNERTSYKYWIPMSCLTMVTWLGEAIGVILSGTVALGRW